MEYQTPHLIAAEDLYEAPMLLDLEEVSGETSCGTGGSGCGCEEQY